MVISLNGYTASPDKDNKIIFSFDQLSASHNHDSRYYTETESDDKYVKLHKSNYLYTDIYMSNGYPIYFYNGVGTCYIHNGTHDISGIVHGYTNNLDIRSHWGISFSHAQMEDNIPNWINTPAMSIDCRTGDLYIAGNFHIKDSNGYGVITHLSTASGNTNTAWAV